MATLKRRGDMETVREGDQVRKTGDPAQIANEARLLRLLDGTGIAPRLLEHDGRSLVETYVEGTVLQSVLTAGQQIDDPLHLLYGSIRLLRILHDAGVRHSDLTAPNLVLTPANELVALDWHEATTLGEPPSLKHPGETDAAVLWRALMGLADSRILRKWYAIEADLGGHDLATPLEGKMLLDLGCYHGLFCGAAAADGMQTLGVDCNEPAINDSHCQFPYLSFWHEEIFDAMSRLGSFDAVLLLSVWPYLVQQRGEAAAVRLLETLVRQNGVVYFEAQLKGDGPGTFESDEAIASLLSSLGNVARLGTFAVHGRDATRTVWSVRQAR